MVFRDYTYSVLLVSGSEKLNTSIRRLLPVNTYWPVEEVSSVNAARRLLADRPFDIVLINAPLPDEFGSRLAIDIVNDTDGVVLMLAGADIYEQVCQKVEAFGVLAIAKPVTERMISQALRFLCAMLERMKRFRAKQVTVEEKVSEMRLINRAKWLLIEQQDMTEPQAHQYLEKYSMDRRIPKLQAAKEILAASEVSRYIPK